MNAPVLERVLHRLLREANGFDASGLAAVVVDGSSKKLAVAYRADPVKEILKVNPRAGDVDYDAYKNRLREQIVAMVSIEQREDHGPMRGAWEVKMVAGPGKLAYGMAYALAGDDGIIPDRTTVSVKARAAWAGVAKKNDRKRLPIDDTTVPDHDAGKKTEEHPYHTEDPSDDGAGWGPEMGGEVLDWVYYPKGGEKEMLDLLRREHETIERKFPGGRNLDIVLQGLAWSFFGKRVDDVDLGPEPTWMGPAR